MCLVTLALFAVMSGGRSVYADKPRGYDDAMRRASALFDDKKYEASAQEFLIAADLVRETDQPEPELEVRALMKRARSLQRVLDKAALRETNRRIHGLQHAQGEHLLAALTGLDLGYLDCEFGEYDTAIDVLTGSFDLFVKAGKSVRAGHALTRLADAYRLQRDYAQALTRAAMAMRIFDRKTKSRRSRADVLNITGIIHTDLGDADRALVLFEEALTFYGEKEVFEKADVRLNIGVANYVRGDIPEAIEQIEKAHGTYKKYGDPQGLSRSLTQWGFALSRADEHEAALVKLREGVKLAGKDRVSAAYANLYVADALLATNKTAEAQKLFASLLQEGDKLGDRQLQCHARRGLADVFVAQGAPAKALPHLRKSLALVDSIVAGLAPVAGSFGRSRRAATYDAAVRTGFAAGDPELAFELLELSRARSLLARLGVRDVAEQLDPPAELLKREAAARQAVLAAKATYATALLTGRHDRARSAYQARLAAELAYEGTLDELQRHAQKALPLVRPTPAKMAEVTAGLHTDQRLVMFGVTETRAHALVLGKKTKPRLVDLGSAAALATAVDDLALPEADGAELTDAIAALRQRLLDPLKLGTGAKRVLICPDGPLAHVPFQLLDDAREFAFIPSATAYQLLGRRTRSAGTKMFAVGDPAFEVEREGRKLSTFAGSSKLDQLTGSREEIQAIAREGDKVLLGEAAHEDAVRAVLGGKTHYQSVLLATHGFASDRRPSRSGLALSPGAEHDGFLSVVEIFGLQIKTDLLVLSACNSGRGTATHGEGMLGLAGACMYAGAPRIVASLWRVDDDATRAFMEVFHRAWRGSKKTKPTSIFAALRAASKHVRSQPKWEHPKYWAAWVLWGAPD